MAEPICPIREAPPGVSREPLPGVESCVYKPGTMRLVNVACMMYAGLTNSSETHWVEAARSVACQTTFDLGTIRSFARAYMPDAAKMYAFSERVGRVPMIGLMRAMVFARVASSLIREPIFDWVMLSSCVLFCLSTRLPSLHGLAPLISTSKVVARIRASLPAN